MNQTPKQKGGMKKTKLTSITKLDNALFVVGRNNTSVFPLKDKLLNVCDDATHAQITKNQEMVNLVEILGSNKPH